MDSTAISIGYPLANCHQCFLDANMKTLPSRSVGEFCVGGTHVGTGYLNRPDANEHSFVETPSASEDDVARG